MAHATPMAEERAASADSHADVPICDVAVPQPSSTMASICRSESCEARGMKRAGVGVWLGRREELSLEFTPAA